MSAEISVIVPVYNTAEVVSAAVSSALAQSFSNIEIICVDDGSTDGSQAILATLAAGDSRVQVIELGINHGASTARNQGIDRACGNYLFFLDSDDTIPCHSLKKLLAAARTSDCEMAVGKLHWLTATHEPVDPVTTLVPSAPITINIHESPALLSVASSHCCNLYARELLERNDIRYAVDLTYGEDQLFQATALVNANRIAMIDDIVYVYHHYRSQSLTIKPTTLKNLLDDIEFHRRIAALYKRHGLQDAATRFLSFWSYSIRHYWLQIPTALKPMDAQAFFTAFRLLIDEFSIRQWSPNTPGHHRELLDFIVAGRDATALALLANDSTNLRQRSDKINTEAC